MNSIPVSEILKQTAKGSGYFLLREDGNADPKEYMLFRRGGAKARPAEVTKEWNTFMRNFKACVSPGWRNYAQDAPKLSKKMVLGWSKEAE
ncbi:hypothetical protein FBU30_001762, partial [Linnemannia zychae]